MVSCKFLPWRPLLSRQPIVLFKDNIGCRLTRASNSETQLLGYIAWQWDRYLVPQNGFLVQKSFQFSFSISIYIISVTFFYQHNWQFNCQTTSCSLTQTSSSHHHLTGRRMGRRTHKHVDGPRDRQTHRETDRLMEKWTDWLLDRQLGQQIIQTMFDPHGLFGEL